MRKLYWLLSLLAACSKGGSEPQWLSLALDVPISPDRAELVVEETIEPARWSPDPDRDDQWWIPHPAVGVLRGLMGERLELRMGQEYLREISPRMARDPSLDVGPGVFFRDGNRIQVRLPAGPPGRPMAFRGGVPRSLLANAVLRTALGDRVADGFSVLPGESIEVVRDVPAHSALCFQSIGISLGATAELQFSISVDGREVYGISPTVSPAEQHIANHVVPLPPEGGTAMRIAFEVRGGPAATAFLNPVLGPADIGQYGERPWPVSQPDIVVFLADTFRADNLEIHGGRPEQTPALNELARRSLRCLRARSTSIWTLPSHGSLFTGVNPPQHGAVTPNLTLADELVTIAEYLQAHGYRTGAVTDSAYVSRQYGLDQGFEWFAEIEFNDHNLMRTLELADDFLDRDDGRPVFLFVHTYRTHMPYRQGLEESTAARNDLFRRAAGTLIESAGQPLAPEVLDGFRAEYRALYLGGVRALDEAVGPWVKGLERRGLLENGVLCFTSDHGEEFYEHGGRGHDGMPHEEKVRIPMFFYGGLVQPGDVNYAVSLIDLAPTMADWAGLPPLGVWEGQSLLALNQERLLFTHNAEGRETYLSVVDEDRKLITVPEGDRLNPDDVRLAFDLGQDPHEQRDLSTGVAWPQDLARKAAPLWRSIAPPLVEVKAVQASEALRTQLRLLGY